MPSSKVSIAGFMFIAITSPDFVIVSPKSPRQRV